MMGKSSRFFKEGYKVPKFMLLVGEESLFSLSVRSFERYFHTEDFAFAIPDDDFIYQWLLKEIDKIKITNFEIIKIPYETRGQADTVSEVLKRGAMSSRSVYIFNIDTILLNFTKDHDCNMDGYLEVFRGQGDHWSFAEVNNSGLVSRTSEKERISDLCSNGLYYFKSEEIFLEGFNSSLDKMERSKETSEIYIAPIYNHLISLGLKIGVKEVDLEDILFSGTPSEYENLLKQKNTKIS